MTDGRRTSQSRWSVLTTWESICSRVWLRRSTRPSLATYVPDATDALYDADVADAVERWDVPDDPQLGRPQRHRRLPAHLADSLWRCSDLTMTLRPFISVVSYSLSSICLLLVPFSLDLPTFPHIIFVSFSISSSPYTRFFFLPPRGRVVWLAGGNVTVSCI